MEWVEWMWRVALSLANTEARPSGTCRTDSFITKIEMAMRIVEILNPKVQDQFVDRLSGKNLGMTGHFFWLGA